MEQTRSDGDSASPGDDQRTVDGFEAAVEVTGDFEIEVYDSIVHRSHEQQRYPTTCIARGPSWLINA